ncbi:MAG: acyl carrier protein [Acidimicrobiales bacterium]|nr:acyl carrier protein [Acidimicrobiales bacterium]
MRDQMLALIRAAVDEIGAELDEVLAAGAAERGGPAAIEAAPLYGAEGPLSSLELVSVLVALEQSIEDRFGRTVNLADDQAMSEAHSPFRTFGSLADLALDRLTQR